MTRTLMIVAALLLPLAGCETTPHDHDHNGHGPHTHMHDDHHHAATPYRHVVVFRFKPQTTQAEIDQINAAFEKLPEQIDTIRHFEYGVNVSPEGLADGFTHCYIVTFDDKAGLETYLPHPAHKAFVDLLKPKLDKPFVIDYVPSHMR